jgi:hypothetical protein
MDIVLSSLAFVLAVFFVGVMGFAIQRGATCTVAAAGEVVDKRSFRRLVSLVEAVAALGSRASTRHMRSKPPALLDAKYSSTDPLPDIRGS